MSLTKTRLHLHRWGFNNDSNITTKTETEDGGASVGVVAAVAADVTGVTQAAVEARMTPRVGVIVVDHRTTRCTSAQTTSSANKNVASKTAEMVGGGGW